MAINVADLFNWKAFFICK